MNTPSERSSVVPDMIAVLMSLLDEVFPTPQQQRHHREHDIQELSRSLTSEKSQRRTDYMSDPKQLNAYMHYFMPWNIIRLAHIFSLCDIELRDEDRMLDMGSGPLTLVLALWIAKPVLRQRRVHIDCVDRSGRALDAGKRLLEALALRTGHELRWHIETRREVIHPKRLGRHSYDFVAAANVFNETFWHENGTMSERARGLASFLLSFCNDGGHCLIVEPGEPRSGAMLASLREALLAVGVSLAAPCPHEAACPMPGMYASRAPFLPSVIMPHNRIKMPWCHFLVDISMAPPELKALSEKARLPKERLSASWLLFRRQSAQRAALKRNPEPLYARVISDEFFIPGAGPARYACSRAGYTLLKGQLAMYPSGALVPLDASRIDPKHRDAKSNAILIG